MQRREGTGKGRKDIGIRVSYRRGKEGREEIGWLRRGRDMLDQCQTAYYSPVWRSRVEPGPLSSATGPLSF